MKIFELSNETWGVSNSARVYLAKDANSLHPDDNNVLQLLGLLFVFVLVLLAAWYVSKFIGNKTMSGFGNKNINIIETFNMGNNKAIQIVRIANKYMAIGIGKDEINVLTELNEEDVVIREGNQSGQSFKDLLNSNMLGKNILGSAKNVLCKSKNITKGSKNEENSN